MKLRFMIGLIVLYTAVGCTAADSGTTPLAPPQIRTSVDCEMLEGDCSRMENAINYLLRHPSGDCRAIGRTAQDRFNAPMGVAGYKYITQTGDGDMGVAMHPVPLGTTSSGMAPDDGYVGVMPNFWQDPAFNDARLTAGLIAHEEIHQYGQDDMYHNTGMAQFQQTACSMEL